MYSSLLQNYVCGNTKPCSAKEERELWKEVSSQLKKFNIVLSKSEMEVLNVYLSTES